MKVSKVRVELHSEGFRDVLASDGCRQVIQANTDKVYGRLGEYQPYFKSHVEYLGFGQNVKNMKHPEHSGRYVGFIDTKGKHPNYGDMLEAKHKILTRAAR